MLRENKTERCIENGVQTAYLEGDGGDGKLGLRQRFGWVSGWCKQWLVGGGRGEQVLGQAVKSFQMWSPVSLGPLKPLPKLSLPGSCYHSRRCPVVWIITASHQSVSPSVTIPKYSYYSKIILPPPPLLHPVLTRMILNCHDTHCHYHSWLKLISLTLSYQLNYIHSTCKLSLDMDSGGKKKAWYAYKENKIKINKKKKKRKPKKKENISCQDDHGWSVINFLPFQYVPDLAPFQGNGDNRRGVIKCISFQIVFCLLCNFLIQS